MKTRHKQNLIMHRKIAGYYCLIIKTTRNYLANSAVHPSGVGK